MKEAVKEINRQRIARLAKKLEEHNFGVTAVETAQEAFEFLKREIPKHSTIGTGGSVGELYLGKLERKLLGCGDQIGSYSPTQELVPEVVSE